MSCANGADGERDDMVRLPADRAFVVQLRPAPLDGTDEVWAGRVEHVVSGRSARFDDCAQLRGFIEDVLAGSRRSSGPGREQA